MSTARLAGLSLLAALALLVVLRFAWVGGPLEEHPAGEGQPAAAFSLPLLGGGEFRMSGGAEPSVTLIDFFATWCAPCRHELPHLDALYDRYKDRGVRVVAVSAEPMDARPLVDKLAADLHLHLPVALGGDGVAEQYKVDNLPTVMIIDRNGRVRRALLGAHSEEEIARLLDDALR